jgi:hypothetical protein
MTHGISMSSWTSVQFCTVRVGRSDAQKRENGGSTDVLHTKKERMKSVLLFSERTITMRTGKRFFRFCVLFAALCPPVAAAAQTIPSGAAIDAEVSKIMTHTHAKGMAVAVIEQRKVLLRRSHSEDKFEAWFEAWLRRLKDQT